MTGLMIRLNLGSSHKPLLPSKAGMAQEARSLRRAVSCGRFKHRSGEFRLDRLVKGDFPFQNQMKSLCFCIKLYKACGGEASQAHQDEFPEAPQRAWALEGELPLKLRSPLAVPIPHCAASW